LVVLVACKKKELIPLDRITNNDYYVAIPLISGNIALNDILKSIDNDTLQTDDSGLLKLVYSSDPMSFSLDDLGLNSVLPSTGDTTTFPIPDLPAGSSSISSSHSIVKSFEIDMNSNSPEIREIELSQGNLSFDLTNTLNDTVKVVFSIPSLINSLNQIFIDSATLYPSNPIWTNNENLSNYKLDLTKGSDGFNQIIFDFSFELDASSDLNPASTNEIEIEFALTDMDFNTINGDFKNFKQLLDPINYTIDVFGDVFGNSPDSSINFGFTNPFLNFNFTNGMGLGAFIGMDEMHYENNNGVIVEILYDSAATSSTQLSNPANSAPFYLPQIGFDVNGLSIDSKLSMNNTNSTIAELISREPITFIATPFIEINPNPNISNNNFLRKDSINFTSEVELPIEGYAGGWKIADTIDFDFQVDSLTTNETEINNAQIKFVTNNGWPLDVSFTLQLLNENDDTLSSIANQEIILESGFIDQNGRVTSATSKTTILDCNNECVDNLNNTKKVILSVEAKTEGYDSETPIKIYNEQNDQGLYEIKLSMALLIAGKVF
jgi:hypothetical protein